MAKGDHARVENEINQQRQTLMPQQQQLMNTLGGANQGFQNTYNQAAGANLGSYNDIMGMYQSLYNNPFGPSGTSGGGGGGGGVGTGAGSAYDIYSGLANNGGGYGWDPLARGAASKAIGGFGEFADTGGFSPQNIQDIRARAIAPSRAVYQQGMDQIQRQRAIQPFSPNANSAIARMARNSAIDIGDINTNANAAIAQMVQQGRLAGLGGLSQTGLGVQGASTDIDKLNAQMKLAGLSGMSSIDAANASAGAARSNAELEARLAALSGARQLFGTTPGMMETSGNQLLQSGQNLIGGTALGNQLGSELINARLGNSQVPGNFQSAMGNIASGVGLAGALINPLGSLFDVGKDMFNGGGFNFGRPRQNAYGMTGNPYGYSA